MKHSQYAHNSPLQTFSRYGKNWLSFEMHVMMGWRKPVLYVLSELDECLHWEEVSFLLVTKHTKVVFLLFLK